MKNILHIFKSDFRHMTGSVVCLVMIIGLSLVPCLYAWMNVMSTFDPYSEESTSRLKIAVATDDIGTEIYGVKLNMGDMLVDSLKADSTLGWVFPDSEAEAVKGVESGEYYAAIVVPADFSEQIVAFRRGEYEHPKLIYFQNSKANIIASKITDKAKDTVRDELNGAFTSTLVKSLLSAVTVSKRVGTGADDVYDDLITKLNDLNDDMTAIQKSVKAMDSLTDSSGKLVKTTQGYLPEVDSLINDTSDELDSIWNRIEKRQASSAELRKSSVLLLQQSVDTLDAVDSWITAAMADSRTLADDSGTAIKNLNATLTELSELMNDSMTYILKISPDSSDLKSAYDHAEGMISSSQKILSSLITFRAQDSAAQAQGGNIFDTDSTSRAEYGNEYSEAVSQGQSASASAESLLDNLKVVQTSLSSARQDIKDLQSSIDSLDSSSTAALDSSYNDLANLSKDLVVIEDNLHQDITNTRDSLTNLIDDLSGEQKLDMIIDLTQSEIKDVADLLGKTDGVYDSTIAALNAYAKSLGSIDSDLSDTKSVVTKLQGVTQNILIGLMDFKADGNIDHLLNAENLDADVLSDYLAEPVKLDTVAVYEVDNYGSASAPFYTLLSLWVGAIFTMAMIRTRVDESDKPEGLKNWQEYTGRYALIFALGQLQALATGMGICFYIGIDCAHPWLFILGCQVASLVFTLIVYSFSYAMGSIGLGIGVILILLQVAGSGGSFPIEVLPDIYQKLYPFMPFKPALAMLRETVGGFYQNVYWTSMLQLLMFGLVMIPVGLVLRKIYAPFYNRMKRAMEKTGLMY